MLVRARNWLVTEAFLGNAPPLIGRQIDHVGPARMLARGATTRRNAARIQYCVGGSSNSSPRMSVRKPGSSSRKPPSTVRKPRPSSSIRLMVRSPNASRTRATSACPAWRMIAMPASEVRIVSASAARTPSLSATATNTAISTKGSISSPKSAHFTNDIRIPSEARGCWRAALDRLTCRRMRGADARHLPA